MISVSPCMLERGFVLKSCPLMSRGLLDLWINFGITTILIFIGFVFQLKTLFMGLAFVTI